MFFFPKVSVLLSDCAEIRAELAVSRHDLSFSGIACHLYDLIND